jgi:nucleoside-diphosphate-sugar epimerase
VVVLRPAAIYGPGDTRHLKLFRAIARGHYAVVGSGRAYHHAVYIEDLLDAYELALERPQAAGEAFIIAGPRYVSQTELAALIARHTGGRVLPIRIPAAPVQFLGDLCEAVCVPFGVEPPLAPPRGCPRSGVIPRPITRWPGASPRTATSNTRRATCSA